MFQIYIASNNAEGSKIRTFLAPSVRIKLALPQAAQLSSIFEIGKSVVLHLCEGPLLRKLGKRENKKGKHSAGYEPTTSEVLLRRRVLFCCATTAARTKT